MAYRILIPLDGSRRSEHPVPFVDSLAGALAAEVALLRVIDPADRPATSEGAASPESLESSVRQAEDWLREVAKRFRRVQPTVVRVQQGPASQMIVQQAQSGGFDLVVMASQGQTGLAGALLGSVARTVVRESAVPVLVMRESVAVPEDAWGLNVLVPLDGSTLAEAVLAPLLPLAKALDWRLSLLWVAELPAGDVVSQAELLPADERARQERPALVAYLEQLAGEVRASGVGTDVRLGGGARGQVIIELAQQKDVDLVAMSTHGRRGVARLVLGSVTEHVVLHASKPVLTVRPQSVPARRGA